MNIPKPKPFKKPSNIWLIAIGIIILLIIVSSLSSLFYTVKEGTRAVVLRGGEFSAIASPGIGMKIPMLDEVIPVDVRTQKAETKTSGQTKDNQMVSLNIAVNYHLDANKLREIYGQSGIGLGDTVISPRIRATVEAVISSYSANTLITDRNSVMGDVDVSLRKDLARYNVIVESVMISGLAFNEKFQDAIEATQVAEQAVAQAEHNLSAAKKVAEATVETAKGAATAARITAESLRVQGGEEYVRLEAVKKWDGKLPTYMTSGSATPFVNIK